MAWSDRIQPRSYRLEVTTETGYSRALKRPEDYTGHLAVNGTCAEPSPVGYVPATFTGLVDHFNAGPQQILAELSDTLLNSDDLKTRVLGSELGAMARKIASWNGALPDLRAFPSPRGYLDVMKETMHRLENKSPDCLQDWKRSNPEQAIMLNEMQSTLNALTDAHHTKWLALQKTEEKNQDNVNEEPTTSIFLLREQRRSLLPKVALPHVAALWMTRMTSGFAR